MIERFNRMMGSRRRAQGVLTPVEREWLGFFGFLALVLTLDRLTNVLPGFRGWAAIVYLVAILALACWSGFRSSIAACLVLVGYVWFIYHFFGISKVAQKPELATRSMIATAVIFPPFAILGGIVNLVLRRAAKRVSEAHAEADLAVEQQRLAQAELWASEEMRSIIVNSSMDAVIGIGPDHKITIWSPNAEVLFGWTRAEAIGSPATSRIVAPNQTLPADASLLALLDSVRYPVLRHQIETTALTKGDSVIDVELYISDHETPAGTAYVVFARDISERKSAEQEIRDLNASLEDRVAERTRQLEAANQELLGFTYSVSHDLRAPLRAIVSNSRIVCEQAKETLDDDSLGLLKRLEHNANKMAQLIDDLLQYARIGRVRLSAHKVDLSAMVKRIAEDLQGVRNGTVVVQPGILVNGDPEMIEMILVNLMGNSWKYVEPGQSPHVEIGMTEDGTIYVRDEGIGFDMKYVDRVWEPFERLHLDAEYPGTGIGLANSKRIVERHGGKMWTESAPGEGTTMYFQLGSDIPAHLDTARPQRKTGARAR